MLDAIKKIIESIQKKIKVGQGRTITIQRLRNNIDLPYSDLKKTLLYLARIGVLELQHGEVLGKTEKDKIPSGLSNIPYVSFVFHVPVSSILESYYEYELLDKKRQIADFTAGLLSKDRVIHRLEKQIKEESEYSAKQIELSNSLTSKNNALKKQIASYQNDNITDSLFHISDIPEHLNYGGYRWKIQLKPVSIGKGEKKKIYNYYYLHAKINKKLVYVQVGKQFDCEKAKVKIDKKIDKKA